MCASCCSSCATSSPSKPDVGCSWASLWFSGALHPLLWGAARATVTWGRCCHTRHSLHRSATVTPRMKRQCALMMTEWKFWVIHSQNRGLKVSLTPLSNLHMSVDVQPVLRDIDLLSGIKTSTFALSLIYVKLFQHRSCLWLFFIAVSETTDQDTFCPSRMEGFCNIFIPEIASASMHWTQHICVLPG